MLYNLAKTQNTMTIITARCSMCGNTSQVKVDKEAYFSWQTKLIQDAFPDTTKEERELLITGIHPECWKQLFAEDEEEN